MDRWTVEMVEARLVEAASVIRRLPSVRVPGYFNTWPKMVVEFADRVGQQPEPMRLPPPRALRSPSRSQLEAAHPRADPPRCRPGPGPLWSDCSGNRTPKALGIRRGLRRRPMHLQRPQLRRHPQPTGAARPNPEAGSAGQADPPERAAAMGHRPQGRRPLRPRRGRRSAPSRLDLRLLGRGRPRGVPNPGTWGRPGTRSTGSTPPGARRPAGRVETRQSTGVDGPGSLTVHRGRRRRRRTDRPGHRPCWAALAQSSAR